MDPNTIINHDQLQAVINRVSFGRSCLDMAWDWEVRQAHNGLDAPGWLIRTSFQRPDTNTGETGRGWGRWWWINYGSTESGVLKTMFAAAKMIVDHELMEAFRVDGARPFDPHNDIEALKQVSLQQRSMKLRNVFGYLPRDSCLVTFLVHFGRSYGVLPLNPHKERTK